MQEPVWLPLVDGSPDAPTATSHYFTEYLVHRPHKNGVINIQIMNHRVKIQIITFIIFSLDMETGKIATFHMESISSNCSSVQSSTLSAQLLY